MLAIRLPDNIEKRLIKLAEATGRTKTYYAREAIMQHLENLEDEYMAVERLKDSSQHISHTDVEKMIDLDN